MHDGRRVTGIERGEAVVFEFAGEPIAAYAGESIAAALIAAAMPSSRRTRKRDEARGYFCGMGACWDCVVEVDGVGLVRGCMHPVSAGLRVSRAPG